MNLLASETTARQPRDGRRMTRAALTGRQAGRPRTGRARPVTVLISWRGGFGVPRYPAPGQAGDQPAARSAPDPAETRDGAR